MNPEFWQQLKSVFNSALDLAPEQRPAYLAEACAGDDELRRRVDGLLASHENAGPFLRSPAVVDAGLVASAEPTSVTEAEGRVGQRIGPYEIIRELGHGGMGTVFLAVRADDQYRKLVAIKLVNRGMDTDLILRRFIVERQILANLEHPNIASLLDGGSTQDGLPYFVMEYIEGQPITDYCDEQRFTIAQRLALFRQVCEALQYAHQNLVVHRDIKPGNILVTVEGVPKLLDFGIAKLLNPGWATETGDATASMVRLLTPEYASPEQFRGLSITTATDVYSLGLVLYELLSGHHPYHLSSRQPEEIARLILEEEPEKPSAAATRGQGDAETRRETNSQSEIRNPKSLRGDLDNIVLKALRKEPQRRYASVQEFSEDIRRHLAGLPVMATPDTLGYRAGKFVKRHKVGVMAAAVVVIALCTATVVTTWQARVARRERAKAENRFNQVRKLANSLLFEYHDGIEKLPGSTPLREKMVKDALGYLDNLAAENNDDISLQSELAAAYFKVGEVQGAPSKSSLGDYAGGLESFKKSLAIRERLFKAQPANEEFKLALTRTYQMIGHVSQVTDDIPAALQNYQKAFALFDSMDRKGLDAQRDFATLNTRLGIALSASGESAKATEAFRKTVALTTEIMAEHPENQAVKRDYGVANLLLGDGLAEAGDLNGALASHRRAFAVFEPLVSENNAQSRRDMNIAFGRIADVLSKLGKYREALDMQQKALAIDEEGLKSDPANALARRDVQVDLYKIARNQSELGEMTAALASQRKVIGFCETAVAAHPESSESRGDLEVADFRYGEMLEKTGALQPALESYKKALTIGEAMSKADPTNAAIRSDISECYLKVSDVYARVGKRPEALAGYLKALAMREKLITDGQESSDSRDVSARIYESLGAYFMTQATMQRQVEDWREAVHRYQQSLDIWSDLQKRGTLSPVYVNKPNEVKQKIGQCEAALRN
jgi:serine/threonine protein kinase